MTAKADAFIDTMRQMRDELDRLTNRVPAGLCMAFDVETAIRLDPRCMTAINLAQGGHHHLGGLPYRVLPDLQPGEWFTYDRHGDVMEFNGDRKRIDMVAVAARCGFLQPSIQAADDGVKP